MIPNVLGLTGYARSGKDSIAAILKDVAGYERVALADPLREMALAIDPLVATTAHYSLRPTTKRLSDLVARQGWETAKAFPDVRRLLQRLGTEGGRAFFGQDCWVDLWAARARDVLADGGRVVCTDVRFPNEAEAVRELGGTIWRVQRLGVETLNDHSSESGIDAIEPDLAIMNDRTLDDLTASVLSALGRSQ